MPWLSILSGVLKLGSVIAQICRDKGLMDAGAAKQLAETQGDALAQIRRAMDARRSVNHSDAGVREDPDNRD